MIYKLLSCFFLISISAYGNKRFAISTQSFDLPNIPATYNFTNIHKYKPDSETEDSDTEREHNAHRNIDLDPKRYPVIQYAPLNYDIKTEVYQEDKVKSKGLKSVSESVSTSQHVYRGREKPKNEQLEPKPLKEDDNVNQKKYRSFITGHNVATYPETVGHDLVQGVDPFLIHQDYLIKQKVGPPKYYEKPNNDPVITTPKQQNIFLEFYPPSFSSARKAHKKSLPYAYSLYDQLSQEKQQQAYAHPRIHLNIARSYSIANQPAETHLPPRGLASKPLAITSLILNPLNTLMYPIRKRTSDGIKSFS